MDGRGQIAQLVLATDCYVNSANGFTVSFPIMLAPRGPPMVGRCARGRRFSVQCSMGLPPASSFEHGGFLGCAHLKWNRRSFRPRGQRPAPNSPFPLDRRLLIDRLDGQRESPAVVLADQHALDAAHETSLDADSLAHHQFAIWFNLLLGDAYAQKFNDRVGNRQGPAMDAGRPANAPGAEGPKLLVAKVLF